VRIARAFAVWLIASLMTLTVLSCSAPAEQRLLTQFFAASRLRDLTALHNFATIVFEPGVQGVVTSFDVTRVTATQGSDGQVVSKGVSKDVSKDVSISAPVRLPDGRMVLKNFVITMQRGLPGSDQNRWGGWMITAIRDGSGSPSTPRS
jgi:hypothetical protein